MKNKTQNHITKKIVHRKHEPIIQIPGQEPVFISAGTVPSSGATVAPKTIFKEFKKAAQSKLIPSPQEFNLPQD